MFQEIRNHTVSVNLAIRRTVEEETLISCYYQEGCRSKVEDGH